MSNTLTLLPFQVEPAKKLAQTIRDYFRTDYNRGRILIQPAGTGKTYEVAWALLDVTAPSHTPPSWIPSINDFYNGKCLSYDPPPNKPPSIMIITPAQVRTQFSRVLLDAGLTNFICLSPSTLVNSEFATCYLSYLSVYENGSMQLNPVWDMDIAPRVIILDEAQTTKNNRASISKIIKAAINQGILVILVSATPFTRLKETEITCRALQIMGKDESHLDAMRGFIFNTEDYEDYNCAAMGRFNDYLIEQDLKIEAHGIKFPHRVFNHCILIEFKRPEHRIFYQQAYDRWKEECRKQDRNTPEGIAAIWTAMTKFRQAAELIRAEQMCEIGLAQVILGKQVLIASNFVATLDNVAKILINIFNVKAERISTIIGGQNAAKRQGEIDKFQRGDTDFCLLTLKSGGAGLSLHHEKQYPNAKPRYCILPPTYSAIELVQVLGRAHRITSISTTRQDIIWYADTIEEEVAAKVARKMKSLREIVNKKEVWLDLFDPDGKFQQSKNDHTIEQKLIAESSDMVDDGVTEAETLAVEAYEDDSCEEVVKQ